jgi:hypothetical protein
MGAAYKDAVMACLSDKFEDHLGQDSFAVTFEKTCSPAG